MTAKLSTKEFVERSRRLHGDRYDYSKAHYSHSHDYVTVICLECQSEFEVKAVNHAILGRGCPDCNKTKQKYDADTFFNICRSVHDNRYNYDMSEYKGLNKHIAFQDKQTGESYLQVARSHLKGQKPRKSCNLEDIYREFHFRYIDKMRDVGRGKPWQYDKTELKWWFEDATVTCLLHGDFEVTPNEHINMNRGCRKCGDQSRVLTTEEFVKKARLIHGDELDFTNSVYIRSSLPVTVRCPTHGEFSITPNSLLCGTGCSSCKQSKGEKFVAALLSDLDVEFDAQYTICIENRRLRVDFLIPSMRLAIEYDGAQHYSLVGFDGERDENVLWERFEEIQLRDTLKNEWCADNGYTLIRIPFDDPDSALDKIIDLITEYWLTQSHEDVACGAENLVTKEKKATKKGRKQLTKATWDDGERVSPAC